MDIPTLDPRNMNLKNITYTKLSEDRVKLKRASFCILIDSPPRGLPMNYGTRRIQGTSINIAMQKFTENKRRVVPGINLLLDATT